MNLIDYFTFSSSLSSMQLVYSLVPKDQSLEKMIEKRAYELARKIVLKTSHTMHLENQGLDDEAAKAAIEKRAEKIKNELPKNLWDCLTRSSSSSPDSQQPL